MNKENCVLKLVDEIILYCDARSKKHQNLIYFVVMDSCGLTWRAINDLTFTFRVSNRKILFKWF